MQRFLRGVGRLLSWFATMLWQTVVALVRGIGEGILHTVHRASAGLGRLIGRALPLVLGAGGLYWLILHRPDIANTLITLGVCVVGLWIIIRGIRKKPERRRR